MVDYARPSPRGWAGIVMHSLSRRYRLGIDKRALAIRIVPVRHNPLDRREVIGTDYTNRVRDLGPLSNCIGSADRHTAQVVAAC